MADSICHGDPDRRVTAHPGCRGALTVWVGRWVQRIQVFLAFRSSTKTNHNFPAHHPGVPKTDQRGTLESPSVPRCSSQHRPAGGEPQGGTRRGPAPACHRPHKGIDCQGRQGVMSAAGRELPHRAGSARGSSRAWLATPQARTAGRLPEAKGARAGGGRPTSLSRGTGQRKAPALLGLQEGQAGRGPVRTAAGELRSRRPAQGHLGALPSARSALYLLPPTA